MAGTRKVKKWVRMTEKDFATIKTLQDSTDLPDTKIAEITGRSYSTVNGMRRYKTLKAFREYQLDEKNKSDARRGVVKANKTAPPQEAPVAQDLLSALQDVTRSLSDMCKRLDAIEQNVDWIAQHTEVKPTKGWFKAAH